MIRPVGFPVYFGTQPSQNSYPLLTDQDFDAKVLQSKGVVVVRGFTSKETPQQAYESAKKFSHWPDATIFIVDMDQNPQSAQTIRATVRTNTPKIVYFDGKALSASG